MKTILIIDGTRPEIFKTALIVIETWKRKDVIGHLLPNRQHKTMALIAFSLYGGEKDSCSA
jgi:UDP-N-acetylglucosamine 2-epimerase